MAPELREQLQAHFGSAYTIERELGGGGMSRVFLAREARLARTVVVKVLPPQLAAGVSVDRFEREIQLAARLQHPHIVPLLTAGSAGDLLYYIMPHIEGESLRARLAHDHELPVGETVRILRDVADALAYAHAHGIVHRDVKPDNVLLSGKHALVTDFGVAKAVAESTGKTALTSMGVALGTPAYMAPEQAAADPNTDHRADLYGVGALAYEMLAGRPPFTGTSPQAVLAAQVHQAPELLAQQRPSVPPALAAVVMRCLEKKPADRFQNAEELLTQLEAMATPTGGVTPTEAPTAISSGTQAAIDRAHPARVAGLFALASVGVLAIVRAAVQFIGLPDWVFYGAIGLLALGLPIMLVTGHHERRRALARSSGVVPMTPPGGIQRWFTWRRALAGGGLAFGALAILVALYMAMRLLGIGPLGTLLAAGELAERGLLIVADFDSHTADSTLAPSVTEAFRIDLSQSPAVRLIDGAAVARALRLMNRDPHRRVDAATAQEIAQREGAKGVVVGDVGTLGNGYVLSARLLSSADGSELLALRETANDVAGIIGAVDRLTKRTRERIGESLKTIRANPPLEQVTTGSLEALRRYTEGARAVDLFENTRGIRLLQEAIALDTTFAMAYRKLAVALFNSQGSLTSQFAAARKAYQYRERLPLRERYLATAFYEPDVAKQVAAYQALLETYPDDGTALIDLGIVDLWLLRDPDAEELGKRAIAVVPAAVQSYGLTAHAQIAEGRFAAAESTLATMRRAVPGGRGWWFMNAGDVAAARGDYDRAAVYVDSARQLASEDPAGRAQAASRLADLAALRGRLMQAADDRRQVLLANQERGLTEAPLLEAIAAATIDVRFRDAPASAARRLDAALASTPLGSIPAGDRPYVGLARAYAEAGRPDVARRLLAEYERTLDEWFRLQWRNQSNYSVAIGEVALDEGRVSEAIAELRRYVDGARCPACGLFELARAYDRAGQADSAVAYYEQLARTPVGGPFAPVKWVSLAQSYKRLGDLYEEKADRDKALARYGKFVDLWKDADPELQPVVRDVKQRMARVVGEK